MPELHPEFYAAKAHKYGNKNPKHKVTAKRKCKIRDSEPQCQGEPEAKINDERPT